VIRAEFVSQVLPSELTEGQVAREFRGLVEAGVPIRCVGDMRDDPESLLSLGYTPKLKLALFDATFYLTHLREDANFRFFVAFVVLPDRSRSRPTIYPRIFYKDVSLVWRSPTHYIRSDEDNWIGKGDLKCGVENGEEIEYSAEETTNLPLEIQTPLDELSRRGGKVRRDLAAVDHVLRRAPNGRFEPYRDFSGPRRKAMTDPRNRIHAGKLVARFTRQNDPSSLRFVAGYEPDFRRQGIVEVASIRSRMYGGEVKKLRILSKNRKIQYQFLAAPKHVWIIPPQTLTTELMSYGVRTVDVNVDEDLCVPGFEYHFMDESEAPPQLVSQIPKGFAGRASEADASRADASAWIEAMPVVKEFRRRVPLRFRRK